MEKKLNLIGLRMYDALRLKYMSEVASAEASLLVYFNNSVGIGEHPQHIEEMDKLIEKIANSNDKLQTLEKFIKYESI